MEKLNFERYQDIVKRNCLKHNLIECLDEIAEHSTDLKRIIQKEIDDDNFLLEMFHCINIEPDSYTEGLIDCAVDTYMRILKYLALACSETGLSLQKIAEEHSGVLRSRGNKNV